MNPGPPAPGPFVPGAAPAPASVASGVSAALGPQSFPAPQTEAQPAPPQAPPANATGASNVTGQKRPRDDPADAAAAAKKPTGGSGGASGGQGGNIDKDLKNAALDYLEQVKKRFENNKEVYDKFLDIMKDFQSRILETSGVIKRVSDLFKGERNLILGFNAFLPEGYKITEEMYQNELSRQREQAAARARSQSRAKRAPAPTSRQAAAAASKKSPELEYAKNYVSKIRKRFKHSPEIYQQFLNILQNYQEEQKTVKEVYEQVQRLFQGHNDLLSEFARFLPDPDAPAMPDQPRQANKPNRAVAARKPNRRGSKDDEVLPARRDRPRFTPGPGYKDELEFFKQLKSRMQPQQWDNFVKLCNLYTHKIVNSVELKMMLFELFSRPQKIFNQNAKRRTTEEPEETPDLFTGVMKFLGMLTGPASIFDGKQAAPKELHRTNHDRDAGPSYMCRAQTTLNVTTGRLNPEWAPVCNAVLNDQYVLNPLGTEQSAVLTNTHEMALFRAEDERYELDTMVGRTQMAIAVMEPIAEKLAGMSRGDKQKFDFHGQLGLLPMRTIQKIYGEHGNEMCDLLYDSPAAAVPIILARLKQKDMEYRTVRHQQNRIWQAVFEENYHKALDHRSYAFKVQDKKALHTKSILLALREIPQGITVEYPIPNEDTQLWSVLREMIKEWGDEEEARTMTAWWEGWFCPFLGMEVTAPPLGTPGAKEQQPEKTSKRRSSVREEAANTKEEKILYANHTMATMLRLHQMLHIRLIDAKKMAHSDMNEAGPSRENQLLEPETPRETDSPTGQSPQSGHAKRRHQDPYQAFISCLLGMLRQQVDINKYEDECRTLLGTSSYKLFTMDKLIPRLLKETCNLATSESWRRIMTAHNHFNGIGPDGFKCEPTTRAQYRWKMCEEFAHNCFEVLYNPVTHTMKIMNVSLEEAGEDIGKMRSQPARGVVLEPPEESDPEDELPPAAAPEEPMDEEVDDNPDVAALLNMKSEAALAVSGEEGGEEDLAPAEDGMDIDDEEAPSQEVVRRPALGYGATGKTEEEEEESDA